MIACLATRYVARTLPWIPLTIGCVAGVGVSLAAYSFAQPFQPPASVPLTLRAAFVPLVIAMAFLTSDPHRNFTASFPAPCWLITLMRIAIVLPLVCLTAWIQLRLASSELMIDLQAQGGTTHLPWASLAAELACWSVIALVAAALVNRTRWDDLGGAIAAPAALAIIGLLTVTPLHLLPSAVSGLTWSQRATWFHAQLSWWGLGLIASFVWCWANRDPWLRLVSANSPRAGVSHSSAPRGG